MKNFDNDKRETMAKKRKKKKVIRNPVAKFVGAVNRPATHPDKKNDYKRNSKHKKKVEDDD